MSKTQVAFNTFEAKKNRNKPDKLATGLTKFTYFQADF